MYYAPLPGETPTSINAILGNPLRTTVPLSDVSIYTHTICVVPIGTGVQYLRWWCIRRENLGKRTQTMRAGTASMDAIRDHSYCSITQALLPRPRVKAAPTVGQGRLLMSHLTHSMCAAQLSCCNRALSACGSPTWCSPTTHGFSLRVRDLSILYSSVAVDSWSLHAHACVCERACIVLSRCPSPNCRARHCVRQVRKFVITMNVT